MLIRLYFICCLVSLATFAKADQCDSVLIQNTFSESSTDANTIAAYSLIDEETFNLLKKGGSSSFEGSGNYFEVAKGDIDSSSTYQEFTEKRTKRLKEFKYNETSDRSRDSLRQFLTDSQISGWTECKKLHSSDSYIFVTASQSPSLLNRSVPIEIHYRLPNSIANDELRITIDGGTIENQSSLSVSKSGSNDVSYIVNLGATGEAFIIVSIAGKTDSLFIRLKEKKIPKITSLEQFQKPEGSISYKILVCGGSQTNCFNLRKNAITQYWVDIPLPAGEYINHVYDEFTLGKVLVGQKNTFSLSVALSDSLEVKQVSFETTFGPISAGVNIDYFPNTIKIYGASEDDSEWAQEVTLYYTTAKKPEPVIEPEVVIELYSEENFLGEKEEVTQTRSVIGPLNNRVQSIRIRGTAVSKFVYDFYQYDDFKGRLLHISGKDVVNGKIEIDNLKGFNFVKKPTSIAIIRVAQ